MIDRDVFVRAVDASLAGQHTTLWGGYWTIHNPAERRLAAEWMADQAMPIIEALADKQEATAQPLVKGRYYPTMPPILDGETLGHYSDRLIGVYGVESVPYDHKRNRQCSLGWHEECSDPSGERCKCPCHEPPSV